MDNPNFLVTWVCYYCVVVYWSHCSFPKTYDRSFCFRQQQCCSIVVFVWRRDHWFLVVASCYAELQEAAKCRRCLDRLLRPSQTLLAARNWIPRDSNSSIRAAKYREQHWRVDAATNERLVEDYWRSLHHCYCWRCCWRDSRHSRRYYHHFQCSKCYRCSTNFRRVPSRSTKNSASRGDECFSCCWDCSCSSLLVLLLWFVILLILVALLIDIQVCICIDWLTGWLYGWEMRISIPS